MRELTPHRAQELLKQLNFGYLGLAEGGNAYVLPLFYGYDGKTFYFHSHHGLKERYMSGTKEACMLVTSVESSDEWESIHAFGAVEKVTIADEILVAMNALIKVPLPPEYGVSDQGEPLRSAKDMFFWKLTPRHIEGRASIRPPPSDDMALA